MSPMFLSGECKWYVNVCLKGNNLDDYLRLYLCMGRPKCLVTGWKIRASYCFVLLNQSGKELYRAAEVSSVFCSEFRVWGDRTLPRSKLQGEGFLENNKLIIKVEVKVLEERYVTEKEIFEIQGFEVPSTQVYSVSQLFIKHPDIATNFKLKGKGLKIAYMNLLLNLIKTLCRPPLSFSETELSNAESELCELTEAGFKLDWLKTKLEKIYLTRKYAVVVDSRVENLEERIKNLKLTLSHLKVELESEKAISAAANKPLSFDDIV